MEWNRLHIVGEGLELNQFLYTLVQDLFMFSDSWHPIYHVAPPYGLLNDPNGFSYFAGQYWLYFQWNPNSCEHSDKHWGLMTSNDLVHWQQQPFKMAPEHWFDKDGCYSGTGLVEDGLLSLFYTGNVRHGEVRESYQCLVTTADGKDYQNHGPLWSEQFKEFTGHVRDPKVFLINGHRRMWLAAQRSDLIGGIAVLNETTSGEWDLHGHYYQPIGWAHDQLGYMWECPDRLVLGEQIILVCCVQGVKVDDSQYGNTNLSGYFSVDEEFSTGAVTFTSDYHLLDHGFDFYAPQTMVDAQQHTVMIGWMGLPDSGEHPTVSQEGWCEQLTLPRICQWKNNHLWQRPLPQLVAQFEPPTVDIILTAEGSESFLCDSACLMQLERLQGAGQLILGEAGNRLVISWSDEGLLTIDRSDVCVASEDTLRHYTSQQSIHFLQLFVDHSSFEVFINDGEAVMSGRIFAKHPLNRAHAQSLAGHLTVQSLAQRCVNVLTKEQWSE